MPSANISASPSEVFVNPSLMGSVQNTGTSNVYIGVDNSVTADSHNVFIAPNVSFEWPANTPLWAVCLPGQQSVLSYIMNGVSIGGAMINTVTYGSGAVFQLKTGVLTGAVSSTSGTYADTGLAVNIAPSSANNKIKVTVSFPGWENINANPSASGAQGIFNIFQGTQLIEIPVGIDVAAAATGMQIALPVTAVYLDSPGSTSMLTYKCQFKLGVKATTVYANQATTRALITVEEILP